MGSQPGPVGSQFTLISPWLGDHGKQSIWPVKFCTPSQGGNSQVPSSKTANGSKFIAKGFVQPSVGQKLSQVPNVFITFPEPATHYLLA